MYTIVYSSYSEQLKSGKYQSVGKWINEMCYIHAIAYYAAIKRNYTEY